ncbi:MAG: hypothetical protein AAB533_02520 [Patescibacteria group bacterium]
MKEQMHSLPISWDDLLEIGNHGMFCPPPNRSILILIDCPQVLWAASQIKNGMDAHAAHGLKEFGTALKF